MQARVVQLLQMQMGIGMPGNLVILIHLGQLRQRQMPHGHAALLEGMLRALQAGIKVKGTAQMIAIQNFNQPNILLHTVVIAEGKRFHFAVPHRNRLLFLCFLQQKHCQ